MTAVKKTVKKTEKMDPKLVAQVEAAYIARTYKIPIAVVRSTMKEIGKNGKPCRSRKLIYAALRLKHYVIEPKRKPKKKA